MENLPLVIGAVALPAAAEAVLWVLHKLNVPSDYDHVATYIVSVVFAVLVVTLKFFPQYDQVIVGTVSFLYTLIMTLQKFLPNTKRAIVKSVSRGKVG
jgi:hypothetical protein